MDQNAQENQTDKLHRLQVRQAVSDIVNDPGLQQSSVARGPVRGRIWIGGTALLFLLIVAAAYLLRVTPAQVPSPDITSAATHPAVEASSSGQANLLKMSGFFTARDMVQISATVLARVKKVHVREGDSVQQGDLLVELDNVRGDNDVQTARQRLNAAQMQQHKAQLSLRNDELEQQRQASLMMQGYSTRKAMDDASLRVAQARAEVGQADSVQNEARAAIRVAHSMQLEYAIRAPFSGMVMSQNARVGEVVSPNNGGSFIRSGLISLLNPATLEVEVSVQERLLPQLQAAGCALVSSLAQPDKIQNIAFKVGRISKTADRQRGAVNAVLVPLKALRELPILETSAEVQFVAPGDPRCSTTITHTP